MDGRGLDALAKDFASGRLSRGQVLKGLVLGAALASFPTLGADGASAAAVASVATADPNVRLDDCRGVLRYVAGTGVRDARGAFHAGYTGWTTADLEHAAPEILDTQCKTCKKTRRGKRCTPVDCDTLPGRPKRGVTVTVALDVKVVWSANPVVSKMQWVPDPPPCPDEVETCRDFVDDFHSQITFHEDKHVADIERRVTETNAAWATKRFTGSGGTAEGARIAALKKATVAADGASATLTKQIMDDGAKVDKDPTYFIVLPDCNDDPCGRDGRDTCAPAKAVCTCTGACYDDIDVCLLECDGGDTCPEHCVSAEPGQCAS